MTETIQPIWTQLTKLPDGHRLFQLKGRGDRLALADDSGETPDSTDDGVLWLDRARPLITWPEGGAAIPLLDANGAETRTPTDMQTLLVLASRYSWLIKGRWGMTYSVRECK